MFLLHVIVVYPHLGRRGKFGHTSSLLYVWGLTYQAGIGFTQNFKLKILRSSYMSCQLVRDNLL